MNERFLFARSRTLLTTARIEVGGVGERGVQQTLVMKRKRLLLLTQVVLGRPFLRLSNLVVTLL